MQAEKSSIMVVDDEILIRDLLFDFLTAKGAEVHLAENGKKAMELIEQCDFQVALIDLKMPEIDGLEVTSALCRKKPQVPVIIMTAYPSMDSAIDSIRQGVFDYIVKPFKIAELFEILSKALAEYEFRVKSGYSCVRSKDAEGKGERSQSSAESI